MRIRSRLGFRFQKVRKSHPLSAGRSPRPGWLVRSPLPAPTVRPEMRSGPAAAAGCGAGVGRQSGALALALGGRPSELTAVRLGIRRPNRPVPGIPNGRSAPEWPGPRTRPPRARRARAAGRPEPAPSMPVWRPSVRARRRWCCPGGPPCLASRVRHAGRKGDKPKRHSLGRPGVSSSVVVARVSSMLKGTPAGVVSCNHHDDSTVSTHKLGHSPTTLLLSQGGPGTETVRLICLRDTDSETDLGAPWPGWPCQCVLSSRKLQRQGITKLGSLRLSVTLTVTGKWVHCIRVIP